MIEVELNGKDEMISILNRDIERLTQQLDSLSHGGDSQLVISKEMEVKLKEKEVLIEKLKESL
jgi:hypothetical protein